MSEYHALAETIPPELMPGYVPVEPVAMYGPDLAYWTMRDLLFTGQLVLDYEGTPFVEILQNWDRNGPLEIYLDVENVHVLQMIISWHRVAEKTPADYCLFPKFPFKLKIDRHCNFSYEDE